MESIMICAVCSCPPPNGKSRHYRFYGAIVCMSCKAFFKRCYDTSIIDGNLKYSCRHNTPGQCDVHYQSKAKPRCKHCRFLKCHSAGMKPDQIKSGEEREKYTKNCFKKKTKGIFDVSLDERMNDIISAYQKATASSPLDQGLVDYLVLGHSHQTEWTYNHTKSFLSAMSVHTFNVMKMISKLDFLEAVCHDDRNLLFQLNQYLFYQYIVSRYFKGGSTQICWFLEKDPAEFDGKLKFHLIIAIYFLNSNVLQGHQASLMPRKDPFQKSISGVKLFLCANSLLWTSMPDVLRPSTKISSIHLSSLVSLAIMHFLLLTIGLKFKRAH